MRFFNIVKDKGILYVLMRKLTCIKIFRNLIIFVHNASNNRKTKEFKAHNEKYINTSLFKDLDVSEFVKALHSDGISMGLKLPSTILNEILNFSENESCYADRSASCGFRLKDLQKANTKLNKNILVAQYFNTVNNCSAIEILSKDPVLKNIACMYLGSVPKLVSSNLWWTFPGNSTKEDRDRHAHMFHRDIDDFKFVKFFFYLTDVASNDGAHIFVKGSSDRLPNTNYFDKFRSKRYSDDEVSSCYGDENILELCDKAGNGFAEDTFYLHKGQSPTHTPRLLFQLQFSLFDYGTAHDHRSITSLQNIV